MDRVNIIPDHARPDRAQPLSRDFETEKPNDNLRLHPIPAWINVTFNTEYVFNRTNNRKYRVFLLLPSSVKKQTTGNIIPVITITFSNFDVALSSASHTRLWPFKRK
uniref:Uncharacterized protein n=1 Tax=Aplanochytrium stocchinoi TaxID=215587 RepID=A0A7S3PPZ9_9STRA